MGKTTKQDSTPVRIENNIVAFCESRKATAGSARLQIEQALRKSPDFWQNYLSWAKDKKIEVPA